MAEKSSTRTQVLISILGGLFIVIAAIISSPNWFKYFFPEQFVEQEAAPKTMTKNEPAEKKEDNVEKEKADSGTELLVVNKLELCPISSKIPSYLYIELKNNGTKRLKNVSVTIDLGRAEYKYIDFSRNNFAKIDTTRANEIIVTYSEMAQNDSKSIYCLLSLPVFNSIKLNGENLKFASEYTYKDLMKIDEPKPTESNGFYIFLQFLMAGILIVFAVFFVNMVYIALKKKELIDLE